MSTVQVNTRIDASIKERGDVALAQAGYSPTQVVRTVWAFAASQVHDPQAIRDFLSQAETERDSDRDTRIAEKKAALERIVATRNNLAAAIDSPQDSTARNLPETHQEANALSDRDLRGEVLFSRWEERGLA